MILLSCLTFGANPQQRVSIGFYNVENLCDTLPSPFYDDTDWTPGGRLGWNTERYSTKLANIAKVIDDAGFDLLGIAEVESEGAVRDLVLTLKDDYNYIHRTTNDVRGMDMAFIYKGDKFFPERISQIRSGTSRRFLHISGKLYGAEIDIIVCHMPSRYNSRDYRAKALQRLRDVADSLSSHAPARQLMVMGDFNCSPDEPLFRKSFGRLSNGVYIRAMMLEGVPCGNRGTGSYAYDGKWAMVDNIILSLDFSAAGKLTLISGGVFVRDYMLSGERQAQRFPVLASYRGYPNRTFTKGQYTEGFSDHLPVYVIIDIN